MFTGVEEMTWELEFEPEVGAGWFLDAWPFLVPPGHPDRMILGRNAYGAILTLENANADFRAMRVCLLDPIKLRPWPVPGSDFGGLIGRTLPLNQILGMKVARPLGGELLPSNFQPEDLVDSYQSLVPTYAQRFT